MVRLIGFRASPREVWQIAHMARLNAFAGFGLVFFLHVLRFADAADSVIWVDFAICRYRWFLGEASSAVEEIADADEP